MINLVIMDQTFLVDLTQSLSLLVEIGAFSSFACSTGAHPVFLKIDRGIV